MGLFSIVQYMVPKVQSGTGIGFKGLFVCFLAQGKFCGQNIVLNFYPKVNDFSITC